MSVVFTLPVLPPNEHGEVVPKEDEVEANETNYYNLLVKKLIINLDQVIFVEWKLEPLHDKPGTCHIVCGIETATFVFTATWFDEEIVNAAQFVSKHETWFSYYPKSVDKSGMIMLTPHEYHIKSKDVSRQSQPVQPINEVGSFLNFY